MAAQWNGGTHWIEKHLSRGLAGGEGGVVLGEELTPREGDSRGGQSGCPVTES